MDLRNPMSHLDPGAHHLYLVPGFDPGGTRTLLRLLRHELAQAEPPLKLQGLGHRGHLSQWVVQRRGGGGNRVPLAWVSVLSWDDIVRRRWARTPWRLCWQGLLLYLDYLARPRTWHSMRRLPKASFTFFWPLCFVLILALAALLSLLPLALLPHPLPFPLATVVLLAWLIFGVREAERRRVSWLFRAIHFSCGLSRREGADLAARLDGFAEQIEAGVAAEPERPITVAGHSTGSYLAVNLALRLVELQVPQRTRGGFQLLTLGQNPALMASLSTRERVRRDLASLLDAGVSWTDLTCQDDWMSFAEADLAAVLGRAGTRSGLRHRHVPLAEAAGLATPGAVLNHQFLLHFQYFRHAGAGQFSCLHWLLPPER